MLAGKTWVLKRKRWQLDQCRAGEWSFNSKVRVSPTEKMRFEHRFEGVVGVSHVNVWRKSIVGRGPKAGKNVVGWRERKAADVAGESRKDSRKLGRSDNLITRVTVCKAALYSLVTTGNLWPVSTLNVSSATEGFNF